MDAWEVLNSHPNRMTTSLKPDARQMPKGAKKNGEKLVVEQGNPMNKV
jgi:hypothetical protein